MIIVGLASVCVMIGGVSQLLFGSSNLILFVSTMPLSPVLQFEALNPFKMPNVAGNQDEVMRQGASREDQVKIIQRGPCFFEIGFQHRTSASLPKSS
jgi:hypothetical protein